MGSPQISFPFDGQVGLAISQEENYKTSGESFRNLVADKEHKTIIIQRGPTVSSIYSITYYYFKNLKRVPQDSIHKNTYF